MSRTIFSRSIFAAFLGLSQLMCDAQGKTTGLHSADGFPGDQIIGVFNRIPFIRSKDGFLVTAKYLVFTNAVQQTQSGHVDFSFEEKFSYTPLYKMNIVTNDFAFMAKTPFLDWETNRFHFPNFYSDTMALNWFKRDGVMVGLGKDPKHMEISDTFYVLNPNGKAFFQPVSREEYMRFFLALIQNRIEEKQKHLNEHASRNGAPPPGVDPTNEKLMALVAQNLKADSLWIDYYHRRSKEYTTLLTSMPEAEKKERAFAIKPVILAVERDKQGKLKESIEGGMDNELLTKKDEAKTIISLYEFNPSFFDPRLSPGAVQVMVFRDINGSYRRQGFDRKIKDQFFPGIDFKAFSGLMYK